eukprot:maker-scaffold1195_size56104-snap-gene-0.14 protein:Tk12022 transcript:maker-scaffold1195_size56104-snap-gene-0.14-mRNA-1 annotation:"hypothetical protein"
MNLVQLIILSVWALSSSTVLGTLHRKFRGLLESGSRAASRSDDFDCTRKMLCLISLEPQPNQLAQDVLLGMQRLANLHSPGNLGPLIQSSFNGRSRMCSFPDCPLTKEVLLDSFYEQPSNFVDRKKRSSTLRSRTKRPHRPRKGPSIFRELFRHPIKTPKDAHLSYECQACELKRSSCTSYTIGTYGICGAAWLVGGSVGRITCNVATAPRSLDCLYNTWENCFCLHSRIIS